MRVCDACNEGGSSLHIQSVGSSRAPLCSGVFFSYMVFEDYALSFLAGHCSKILLLKAGLCFLCQLATSSSVLVHEPSMSERLVMEQRSLSLRFPGISRGFRGFKKRDFYSGTGNLRILSSSDWYFNNAEN
jgi:hypothetical protein